MLDRFSQPASGAMADEFPASEHENAARAVIAQAGAELSARRADMTATFVAQLYGRVVPEDVLCYAAADLAALAERAFDFLKDRPPGAPKIRCETVTLKESGARKSVSVIEIVNDDMPFLVDSVMGEVLGEVRLAVQDWRAMLERANRIVADLKTNPPPLPVDEIAEAIQFLQWLLADNFTFLGVRNYAFDGNTLEPDFDGALGV